MAMAYVLLGVVQVIGLFLLPRWPLLLWLQLAALAAFGYWSNFADIGTVPLVILLGLAVVTEVTHLLLAWRKPVEGRRRNRLAAALLGGAAGAAASLAAPLIGVLFAAVVGSLIASLIAAIPLRRDGIGVFLGESIALAMRSVASITIAVLSLFTAFI